MVRHGRWAVMAMAAVLVTGCHTTSHQAAGSSGNRPAQRASSVAPPGPADTYRRLHSPTRAHALAEAAVEGLPLPPGSTSVATPSRTIEQLGGTMILSRADGLR